MGIFTMLTRQPTVQPEARGELSQAQRLGLPQRFEVIAEVLASGSSSADEACAVVGRELAKDGASLDEALEGLRLTYAAVVGTDPAYIDTVALSVAWSEATLGYLHQLSCEDPLTGLASLAHVRSRLAELYRAQGTGVQVRDSHALVIADLPQGFSDDQWGRADLSTGQRLRLSRALYLSRLGEAARDVFAGSETVGRLGPNRIVIIARRDDRLGQRVALLRRLVSALDLGDQPSRVWIEGLPTVDSGAALLLDELARP